MLVLAAALSGTARLGAQTFDGAVRDAASHAPLSGAIVTMMDSAGRAVARTLSGADGSFRGQGARRATRVRVTKIGYLPADRDANPSSTGGFHLGTIDLSHLPSVLAPVKIAANSPCPFRADRPDALALWEQARTGLLATIVARETHSGRVRILRFDRKVDHLSGDAVSQTVKHSDMTASRPFLSAREATVLNVRGYMDEDSTGRTFYGLDADVLLDSAFALSHCFHVERDEARHPHLVGIAFAPVDARTERVDVDGVLWLDRASYELRSMNFHYTGLEPPAALAGAGGELAFQTAPNGIVFVATWNLRIIELSRAAPRPRADDPAFESNPPRYRRFDDRVVGIDDAGGEVVSITWPDGSSWHDDLPRGAGQVRTVLDERPVAGVRVWLRGTDYSAVTDSAGAFTIDDLFPGPYDVRAAEDALARFDIIESKPVHVGVRRGAAPPINLELRSRRDALADICDGHLLGVDDVVLLGTATLADGTPARQVRAKFNWAVKRIDEVGVRGDISGETDDAGAFRVCGLPSTVPVRARLTGPAGVSIDTTFQLAPGVPVVSMHFRLGY